MLALSNSITQASVFGLSKSEARSELSILGRVLLTPGGRWFWGAYRHEFEESFRRIIDDLYFDIYDENPQDLLLVEKES